MFVSGQRPALSAWNECGTRYDQPRRRSPKLCPVRECPQYALAVRLIGHACLLAIEINSVAKHVVDNAVAPLACAVPESRVGPDLLLYAQRSWSSASSTCS